MNRTVFICLVGMVAVASSLPMPDQPSEPVYHPAPHKAEPSYDAPIHAYKSEAKPYNFAYGVSDPYQGLDFGQTEDSDGSTVQGSYQVQLSDGRTQIVKYVADHVNGYHAEVSYKGEAQYPPKSDKKPFVVEPTHKGYPEH